MLTYIVLFPKSSHTVLSAVIEDANSDRAIRIIGDSFDEETQEDLYQVLISDYEMVAYRAFSSSLKPESILSLLHKLSRLYAITSIPAMDDCNGIFDTQEDETGEFDDLLFPGYDFLSA